MFTQPRGDRQLRHVLDAVRRRWPILVIVPLIAAGAAYALARAQTREYSANSALLFQNSQLDQKLFGNQVVAPNTDPTRQAATNLALVELPTVDERVAARLHLPLAQVKSEVSVGSDATADVVSVTGTDPRPALAAKLANSYVQQYIAFRQQADRAQLAQAEHLVQSQLAAIPLRRRDSVTAQNLQSRSEELKLLATLQTGNAEVVQRAVAPVTPSSPRPGRDAAIGFALGLVVAILLVFVVERVDRRIKSPEEIEELVGVPVMGAIPESAHLADPARGGTTADQEAFQMLRARLRYFDVDRKLTVIMVASAEPGEGKTTVALNLARAAAGVDGKRALLVEGDLRRPRLANVIHGAERLAGLSELLSQSHDLGPALSSFVLTQETAEGERSFDILLAGAVPPNPEELLESNRMAALLDTASEDYDMVIIDTPPLGVVGDAIPLIHQADGVLLVTRPTRSHRDVVTRIVAQLRELKAHLLGVVVNGSRGGSVGYGYGYQRRTEPDREPASMWLTRQGRD